MSDEGSKEIIEDLTISKDPSLSTIRKEDISIAP